MSLENLKPDSEADTLKPGPLTPDALKELQTEARQVKMLMAIEMRALAATIDRLSVCTMRLIDLANTLHSVGETPRDKVGP